MTSLSRWILVALCVCALAACNEEEPVPGGAADAGTLDGGGDATTVPDAEAPDVAAPDTTAPDATACTPGATRDAGDGCNTCVCDDGGAWACTEMACAECSSDEDCVVSGCSGQVCAATDVSTDCAWEPEYACYNSEITSCGCVDGTCGWAETDALTACLDDPPCTTGETRPADDGCNTCTCTEDGGWACTEIACGCEPGDTSGDCDECVCDDDGTWVCDDSECVTCDEADAPFWNGCDLCTCVDGVLDCVADSTCEACEPGATRAADDGCNTCTCLDSGRGWACTEIACPEPECRSAEDCMPSGCSGQVCAAEPTVTTCEWLDEYACYSDADVTTCGCFEGKCAWDDTEALADCIEEARAPEGECNVDGDCQITGCSGQLCEPEPTASTCEYLPEYACYAPAEGATSCGCVAGSCAWAATDALATCLADARD